MKDIELWVEEILFDGSIAVDCSKSTLYRWVREMNEYLEHNKYEWRVRPNIKEMSIEVIKCEV